MSVHRLHFPPVRRASPWAEFRVLAACYLVVAVVLLLDVLAYGGLWLLVRAVV